MYIPIQEKHSAVNELLSCEDPSKRFMQRNEKI